MRRRDFAILGFGNVGRALARHVAARAGEVVARFDLELRLTGVIERAGALLDPKGVDGEALARAKEAGRSLAEQPGSRPPPSAAELQAAGVRAVVIALPTNLDGGEPGLSFARAALDLGLDVVLADKGPPLFALPDLEGRAARSGAFLGTSATTGCALPSLPILRGWLGSARLAGIRGVLNGTSNLILTRLRDPAASYASALAQAQRDGIAEPDPRLDVEGYDTAIKLTILARGLLDPEASLAGVARRGITDLDPALLARARSGEGRLRLVGAARTEGGRARITVAPELVPPADPLYDVEGANKAVTFHGDDLGTMTLVGGASSRTGTAWALLRDLLAAASSRR